MIYRSEDGGWTWMPVSDGDEYGWGAPGVRAGFPIDFEVDPRDPNRIFANNYGGGNFASTDGGRTWAVASAGYTGAQVRDIAVGEGTGQVFAAARSGIFTTTDGGATWTGLNTPPAQVLEWNAVEADPANPAHVLAANNMMGVILSSNNNGEQWRIVSAHPGDMMAWSAFAFAPSNPDIVYAGISSFFSAGTFDDSRDGGGIYVSYDNGQNWTPANDALSQSANISELAVAPDNPQTVYAATGNMGLLKTTDGGQSWSNVSTRLPQNRPVLSVRVHPTDPGLVYVGLRNAGLYRSTDSGQSWTPWTIGMNPEASVSDILFDPTNPQTMYATDLMSGVYRSEDGGGTWFAINDGLRMRSVNALALTPDGQHLYAATEGEGVFRLDLNGQPPVE
ncbi:MAG: hypothetical protein GYB65_01825 [Chloroflexi bacterium]|nr:hypothetical protein [Chloroflexota bacterium]